MLLGSFSHSHKTDSQAQHLFYTNVILLLCNLLPLLVNSKTVPKFSVMAFAPPSLLPPSILSHPTESVSSQTFTPLILSRNIFTAAKQEMVLLNRKREGESERRGWG